LFDFTVYPNPTVERLYVNLKEYAGKPAIIQLVNNLGQIMHEVTITELSEESVEFDVSSFTSGIYGMRVKVEGHKQLTRLFVKSKL